MFFIFAHADCEDERRGQTMNLFAHRTSVKLAIQ